MSLFTYTANKDGSSFSSCITWGARRMFIGDTIDLNATEVTALSQVAVLAAGTVAVDLTKFPYVQAKYEDPDGLFFAGAVAQSI